MDDTTVDSKTFEFKTIFRMLCHDVDGTTVDAHAIEFALRSMSAIADEGNQKHTCCVCSIDPTRSWGKENHAKFMQTFSRMGFKGNIGRGCRTEPSCWVKYYLEW